MLLAKIIDDDDREELLMARDSWYLCPYVLGYKTVCGYWETRLDLFCFACNTAGMDYEASVWVDGETGEVLSFWDLCDEELDQMESEAC